MTTIYLVDNNVGSLTVTHYDDHSYAIARARGLLFCKEENAGLKHDQLKEYWSNDNGRWLYNLNYSGSNVYCIVAR